MTLALILIATAVVLPTGGFIWVMFTSFEEPAKTPEDDLDGWI